MGQVATEESPWHLAVYGRQHWVAKGQGISDRRAVRAASARVDLSLPGTRVCCQRGERRPVPTQGAGLPFLAPP